MSYWKISTATVEAPDYKNLCAAYSVYGDTGIVGSYRVTKPLTAAQFRRLPSALKAMLIDG